VTFYLGSKKVGTRGARTTEKTIGEVPSRGNAKNILQVFAREKKQRRNSQTTPGRGESWGEGLTAGMKLRYGALMERKARGREKFARTQVFMGKKTCGRSSPTYLDVRPAAG